MASFCVGQINHDFTTLWYCLKLLSQLSEVFQRSVQHNLGLRWFFFTSLSDCSTENFHPFSASRWKTETNHDSITLSRAWAVCTYLLWIQYDICSSWSSISWLPWFDFWSYVEIRSNKCLIGRSIKSISHFTWSWPTPVPNESMNTSPPSKWVTCWKKTWCQSILRECTSSREKDLAAKAFSKVLVLV